MSNQLSAEEFDELITTMALIGNRPWLLFNRFKDTFLDCADEAGRLQKELEEAQSQVAIKNEELETAYNALEKLQEEYNRLDKGAADDYQKLIEAQQTIAKLHEIVEEGRNALNSIIEGEWEETFDDQFLEVWTTRRINPPAIADEALFYIARELEELGNNQPNIPTEGRE